MSRGVLASIGVSFIALGLAGASAISSGVQGVFKQQLATPQGTGFTFQGRIEKDGIPHDGACDLQFSLFEDSAGTVQVGSTETTGAPVTVTNGLFSTVVNTGGAFGGDAFTGEARWLETAVRCPAGSGSFTTLEPLTELTPVPYATFAMDSASLGGFPADEYARFSRVIIVRSGGTNAENGARLVAAMAEAAAITPGRVLLLLEPGTFDAGAPLQVNANTDIAGIEGGLSTITNTVGQPTLQTVGGTALTNLAISGAVGTGAMLEHSTGSLTLNGIALSGTNVGFLLRSQSPSPSADIFVNDSSLSLNCLTGTCIAVKGAGLSRFYFTDTDISVLGLGTSDFNSAIQTEHYLSISGGVVQSSGRNGSQGTITIDRTGFSASLSLENATVLAQGSGGPSAGITAVRSAASVFASRSTISTLGSNGTINFALDVSGDLTLTDSNVRASGSTQRIGVYLPGSGSSTIERSTIDTIGVDGGSPAIQIANNSLNIRHSHISGGGTSSPIFVQGGSAIITHSSLHGGAIGTGVTCRAVTDETPTFKENECPL